MELPVSLAVLAATLIYLAKVMFDASMKLVDNGHSFYAAVAGVGSFFVAFAGAVPAFALVGWAVYLFARFVGGLFA